VTAGVQSRISLRGICGGHSGTGAGFRRALVFLLPVLIEVMFNFSPISSGAGAMGNLRPKYQGIRSHSTLGIIGI
jgi:hypothetical protein